MTKLLMVEDDAKVRQALSVLIGPEYSIVMADSLAAARQLLEDEDLGVILLDLLLPNGHGRELLEDLARLRDDVPVVVLSGFPQDMQPKKGWPVTDVLSKPPAHGVLKAALVKARELGASVHRFSDSTKRLKDLNEGGTV